MWVALALPVGAPLAQPGTTYDMRRLEMKAGFSSVLLFTFTTFLHAQISEKLLQVHFIDVGTGDCVWIHTGDDGINGNGRMEGYNIIIDGGRTAW